MGPARNRCWVSDYSVTPFFFFVCISSLFSALFFHLGVGNSIALFGSAGELMIEWLNPNEGLPCRWWVQIRLFNYLNLLYLTVLDLLCLGSLDSLHWCPFVLISVWQLDSSAFVVEFLIRLFLIRILLGSWRWFRSQNRFFGKKMCFFLSGVAYIGCSRKLSSSISLSGDLLTIWNW